MSRLAWIKAVFTALLLTFTPLAIAADTPADTTQQVSQLDINSADATTIAESLEGIDMVKAREIVSYREMFGRFRSVDELIEVQGIGEATVEKNRHRIVIVNN